MLLSVFSLWQQGAPFTLPLFLDRLSEPATPACVVVSTEARFAGLAYNHIVHIANGCSVPVSCTVATDVNPEPETVTVAAGARVEVVTFMGSPVRTFTAAVQCAPSSR